MKLENPYYRTFIGLPVELPPPVLAARKELIRLLDKEQISWVDPSLFHITLRFLGDTPAGEIERIAEALAQEVCIPEKTVVPMSGLGVFGPRKRPGVIWTGFEPGRILEKLRIDTERALGKWGIPREEELFRAHLTLGRIRSLHDREGLYRAMELLDGKFRDRVLFDRLIFYRSEPGRGGPVYTPLKILEFGGDEG